jgi:hypothetical protein
MTATEERKAASILGWTHFGNMVLTTRKNFRLERKENRQQRVLGNLDSIKKDIAWNWVKLNFKGCCHDKWTENET